ncbi:MAG: DJ-1/PfpI family protein, partial [Planctomycetota bacterium]
GCTASLINDEPLMKWIKQAVEASEVSLSVCTGAFALAHLGLLDGKEATTWHGALTRMQEMYPEVRVAADRRFIDNGKIITSAGVSAGIDSSLHLVARLLGKPTAIKTATYMEYHWRFAENEPAVSHEG